MTRMQINPIKKRMLKIRVITKKHLLEIRAMKKLMKSLLKRKNRPLMIKNKSRKNSLSSLLKK